MQDAGIDNGIRISDVVRGVVVQMLDGGRVEVVSQTTDEVMRCLLLQTSESSPLQLGVGDEVLIWCCTDVPDGVVLGRLGARHHPEPNVTGDDDHIVIEARQSLTLRVGDGSITIRDDGRILIKGKDLVSHAKRNNRIRGGSVTIN